MNDFISKDILFDSFFSINKLSFLHNNENIIFCKTDYLFDEFKSIKQNKKDVILISGNSDIEIKLSHILYKPKYVKFWFAQNLKTNFGNVMPLPIGLENKNESVRLGHGIGYFDRVTKKEELLSRFCVNICEPNKLVYANFNIDTNFKVRNKVKNICLQSPHIDWEDSYEDINAYFDRILEYESILCPEGNGIDTHRLWEVLYSRRIPIIIKSGNHKIYNLYRQLPIVILNNLNELYDKKSLIQKINSVKKGRYNWELLSEKYWVNLILNQAKLLG